MILEIEEKMDRRGVAVEETTSPELTEGVGVAMICHHICSDSTAAKYRDTFIYDG